MYILDVGGADGREVLDDREGGPGREGDLVALHGVPHRKLVRQPEAVRLLHLRGAAPGIRAGRARWCGVGGRWITNGVDTMDRIQALVDAMVTLGEDQALRRFSEEFTTDEIEAALLRMEAQRAATDPLNLLLALRRMMQF